MNFKVRSYCHCICIEIKKNAPVDGDDRLLLEWFYG